MKKLIKEAFRDAVLLSGLVIVPMVFLGPGWTSPRNRQSQAGFAELHQQADSDNEPQETQRERDIPMLRAFEVERQARDR